eukprot:GHUV01024102.1.p1 GENE.GHUV01024102.1~~GHUV01024102.1.p1  ORF type:complete len:153 (+),score=21.67 GHUV01024102.1:178-636(+)
MAAVSGHKHNSTTLVQLAWTRYKKSLARRPLATKAVTSACVASVSDAIAQKLTGSKYSFTRTLKMALWGLLIGAPSAHYWHQYLQRWFAGKSDSLETAIQKVMTLVLQSHYKYLHLLCMPLAWSCNVTSAQPALSSSVVAHPAVVGCHHLAS